jgi:hypothetical protein
VIIANRTIHLIAIYAIVVDATVMDVIVMDVIVAVVIVDFSNKIINSYSVGLN